MFHYRLFGGVLRSELEFPELEAASAEPPRWTLRRGPSQRVTTNEVHMGTDEVGADVRVHMYRVGDGLRLDFDDTGSFHVASCGSAITWDAPEGAVEQDARSDFTGRVLAAALHNEGTLCLHGSAVAIDGHALGLVAPKKHGKSTLALALVGTGARLLTDDTLPVRPGTPPLAFPGLHATRLWPDSAVRVGLGSARPADQGEKLLFSGLLPESVSHDGAPLSALYALAPAPNTEEGPAVSRTRLSFVESALVIVANTKLAPLLSKAGAAALFEAAATLARQLPVYRLHVVRDLDRLHEVARTLRSWHDGAGVLPAGSASA